MPDEVLSIEEWLGELGYVAAEARAIARGVLERAGLTNPRKTNIAVAKRARAETALAETLVRHCGDVPCRAALTNDPRQAVEVPRRFCEVCEGGTVTGAVRLLGDALQRAGRLNLLVLGGSPSTHTILERELRGTEVTLQLVDGTRPRPAAQARAWAEAADVIVVWGSTMLDHKVSQQFTRPEYRDKTITVARRGIEALSSAVQAHLNGGRRHAD